MFALGQNQSLPRSNGMPKADSCTAAICRYSITRSGRHGQASEAVWQSQVPYRFQIERWKGISIDKNFKFDAAQQLPASCKLFQF
jgi:hypothetical protein